MKATGIVRRIDELGRILIPKEIRRTAGIKENDQLEMYIENNKIVLQKYDDTYNKELQAKEILAKNPYLYETAIITRKGNVITAEVIRNNKRCIGVAACSPTDTFSHYVGELIALARAHHATNLIPCEWLC